MSDQPERRYTAKEFEAEYNAAKIMKEWSDPYIPGPATFAALRMAAAVETPGLMEKAMTDQTLIEPTARFFADAIREAIRKGAQP